LTDWDILRMGTRY